MLTEDSITWIAERQLTENAELEVPNMASISKDVLFYILMFLQLMLFQVCEIVCNFPKLVEDP